MASPPENDAFASARFLLQHSNRRGFKNKAEFARAVGLDQNITDRWLTLEKKPGRPQWENLRAIARALDLPFPVVRRGVGYLEPGDEPPPALDEWQAEAGARAYRLRELLERAPVESRVGLGASIDAALGMLAAEVDRLRARLAR